MEGAEMNIWWWGRPVEDCRVGSGRVGSGRVRWNTNGVARVISLGASPCNLPVNQPEG